jgi:hypothetical protein
MPFGVDIRSVWLVIEASGLTRYSIGSLIVTFIGFFAPGGVSCLHPVLVYKPNDPFSEAARMGSRRGRRHCVLSAFLKVSLVGASRGSDPRK